MAQSLNVNSLINTGLPAAVPEIFTESQVKALAEMMIQANTNLLRGVEQFCGITQKDQSAWSTLTPAETLFQQNLGRLYVPFSENVGFGALVNLYSAAGILTARNSDSSVPKPARGYCNVSTGVLLGEYGEVILSKGIMVVVGVLPGDSLYLSATPGAMQNTPDTTAGHLEQFIGFGVGANLAYIDIVQGTYIQH